MYVSSDQFTIMQGIVAHSDDPSVDDLNRMFPSHDLDTIRSEIATLARKGLVEINSERDIRRYRLKEDHTYVKESGLFDAKKTLHHYFSKTE